MKNKKNISSKILIVVGQSGINKDYPRVVFVFHHSSSTHLPNSASHLKFEFVNIRINYLKFENSLFFRTTDVIGSVYNVR